MVINYHTILQFSQLDLPKQQHQQTTEKTEILNNQSSIVNFFFTVLNNH